MSNQNRVQAGVPAGGQFAATTKAAPDASATLGAAGYTPSDERWESLDHAEKAARRANATLETQTRAALAEGVQRDFPEVAAFTLARDWENSVLKVHRLYRADGTGIEEAEDEDGRRPIRNAIDDELELSGDHLKALSEEVRVAYRDRHKVPPVRFDVAKEAATPNLPEEGTCEGAVASAERSLVEHLERYTGSDESAAYAVQDLLVDLSHYAHAKGLNVDELLHLAKGVAADDRRDWGVA